MLGIAFLVLIYIFPLIAYWLITHFHSKGKCQAFFPKILNLVKVNALKLVLLFFFSTNAILAILSPVFVEHAKDGVTLGTFIEALNQTGYLLLLLLFPIVLISFLADDFIKKVGQYSYYLGGYLDSVTGDRNISLRCGSFIEVLKSSNNAEETGGNVGRAFAEKIKAKNQSLLSSHTAAENKLVGFCAEWTRADEKAGWCTLVQYNSPYSSIEILESIAHRNLSESGLFANMSTEGKQNKVCLFIRGYVLGAVSVIDPTITSLDSSRCDLCAEKRGLCLFGLNRIGVVPIQGQTTN